MRATIYDIAREAGVSIATVSKVINHKGKISADKRREIFAIMERLQYQPSRIASALTGKHTYTLGLLIPDIANPFFAEVARSVEDRGHELGYSIIICSTDNRDERIAQYLAVLRQKQVDGIIIGTGLSSTEVLGELSRTTPAVVIGREVPSVEVHTVVADDRYGGRLAAEHLLANGHRRVGVLVEQLGIVSSRERLRGFRERLAEAQVELPETALRECSYRIEDGKRQAAHLLAAADRPTALFCCNDLLAVGALQAAREAGVDVPRQLSIISFDNTILANVTDPPLTAIAQPMARLGAAAVDLLMEEFGHEPTVKRRIALRTELIVRASTAAVT
ncbi:LacI family DNA-binding transcriptional regulator [Paenibacillus daejeonensis]|uniref:LacI family DNA-binding transcriptional regulator n=1 Tax=Paenibacillus daejeonensis TaxID=135193 RepID=UPI0003692D12|nr:LacI family DNA-binding transcriptional regulator [Paenibacillus daejeonensis]